jgi:urease accessory protein
MKNSVQKGNRYHKLGLLPDLLLLSDSALPTGGFAHSYGLEAFISRGVTNPTELLKTYIHEGLGKVDLPAFVIAFRAAKNRDLAGLVEVDQIINAMKIPREWREAGIQTGKRLQNVSEVMVSGKDSLAGCDFWLKYCNLVKSSGTPGQYPVVAGVVYCLFGFLLEEAALSYAVSVLKSMISASVRLVPLGQNEGLKIQCSLHEDLLAIVERAVMIANPNELGGFAPEFELAGIQHEQLYTRLFIS